MWSCALLPLGQAGPEALDTWQHFALQDWLDSHARPGDAARLSSDAARFEAEALLWESTDFYPPGSLDTRDFEKDRYSAASDSDWSDYD